KHRVELLLFVLLWGTFAYFYQSTQQNEAARFDQTRAIAQEHRLAIDDYWWNSADVIRYTKNGRDYIYPNKAPGTTLLAVPVFWVLFFSHQQAAALLAIAFSLLFALRWDAVFSSWRSIAFLFMAGALMGFSVTTEYPTALLVAILSVYGLWVIGLAGSRSESGEPRSCEMFIE